MAATLIRFTSADVVIPLRSSLWQGINSELFMMVLDALYCFLFEFFCYLCIVMRKKFGDWLLDIAKYMATAILLTSIFSDMQNIWTYVIVAITVVATLLLGLWLTRDKTNEK